MREQAPSSVLKFACREMTCKTREQSFVAQHSFSLEIVGADEGALLRERVAGASSLVVSFVCTGWGTYPGACFGSVFQEQAPSCVPAFKVRNVPRPISGHPFNQSVIQSVLIGQISILGIGWN